MFATNKKILVLEPYYGGSHKSFLQGLREHLEFEFEFLTLPARNWKWRMRLAAPYFVEQLRKIEQDRDSYQCILCSTFVDVASLIGLAPSMFVDIPVLTYFHENQFAYPVQIEMERDFHFALTNFTTALASDRLAFNSSYNLESFLDGCRDLLKKSTDMKVDDFEGQIRAKSRIIHPGIDFSDLTGKPEPAHDGEAPIIVWNHRWEHDKNPELFFNALFELDRREVNFQLVVLGQSFRDQPVIFQQAQKRLADHIIHFGYVKSRDEYVRWLKKSDLVVSTANHEFYGISVIEAVGAGCRPLLPKRLSYPELFPEEFFYEDSSLADEMTLALKKGRLDSQRARGLTERFSWTNLINDYTSWLVSS
ncbi:MAG: DUF3524 domain-containing protein [Proteobacteria bacterium]|nr:DUF3524 domain-containing protein [Pseudomonadota bacterium]MBU1715926.1 DUF3524 domain-containing protein [Pseudomonadota bacterium]